MQFGLAVVILIILLASAILAVVRIVQRGPSRKTIISLITAVIAFTFGLILYVDAVDFNNNFSTSNKAFFFVHDNEVVTGFSGLLVHEDDIPYFYSKEEITELNQNFQDKDYKSMKWDNYKIFIIFNGTFDFLANNVEMGEKEYSREFIIKLIESDNPIDLFVEELMKDFKGDEEYADKQRESYIEQIKENYGDDHAIKAIAFSSLITAGTKQEGPMFLIGNFQYGNIIIYKESMLFKVAKYTPPAYTKMIMERGEENGNNG